MRLSRALIPLVAAASLALTACGGSDDKADKDPQKVSAGTTLDSTWPLTGLDVTGDGSAAQKHPVYIAKIDNTEASNPQIGLGKADMVTEELVEGGITRLAVFFYSDLPSKVGPIRSMRATDVGIASPVGARLVTSGAAPYTYAALKKAGVTWIDMSDPNVVRDLDGTHDTLHSVMANLEKIGAGAKGKETRPEDYFPWGEESDFPAKKAATSIQARFSPARTDDWKYQGGKYVLQNGYMAAGDVFHPDTIVAAQVKTSIAPYKDPAGNPVPVSHFNGKGKAWIFHGGKLVRATWVKKGEDAPISFTLAGGKTLDIPAGKVWLELIPKDGGSITFAKK
ncbi:DUF3048 domain-containing protein [Nocardioides sp. KR10-350]|uniref:DUF3048 domain-containing protein n=1 Tax=Nocardioides cheoyonin TaxID=3156615 RepID=UPI0032B351F6